MKSIQVEIAHDGAVKIDAVGYSGADCDEATRFLEDALGVVAQKDRKPEYHQRGTRRHSQQLGR